MCPLLSSWSAEAHRADGETNIGKVEIGILLLHALLGTAQGVQRLVQPLGAVTQRQSSKYGQPWLLGSSIYSHWCQAKEHCIFNIDCWCLISPILFWRIERLRDSAQAQLAQLGQVKEKLRIWDQESTLHVLQGAIPACWKFSINLSIPQLNTVVSICIS